MNQYPPQGPSGLPPQGPPGAPPQGPPGPGMPPQGPPGPGMPPYGTPPARKSGKGWVIALSILGGLTFLALVGLGVGVYVFTKSDVGQAAFKMVDVSKKSLNAPGTEELRRLGCAQALVVDATEFASAMAGIFDGGTGVPEIDRLVVTCQLEKEPGPTCNDVAAAYVRAVGTVKKEFMVSVQKPNDSEPACQAAYDSSGKFVQDLSGAVGGLGAQPGEALQVPENLPTPTDETAPAPENAAPAEQPAPAKKAPAGK
ncbi:hypothetical protein [Pendulispora albinea]|uniref:Uncharacterized protein n=1 Tax=Pendulispora albinea TaxID=2741071 RepID=A0ABZ2M6P6_9BACT